MSERAHLTIPVVVDSVKRYATFQMTRCIYFSIEAIEPAEAVLTDLTLSYLAFGPSAILYSPLDGERFTTPESIEELFGSIDARPQLVVDTEELWLPNEAFPRGRRAARGDVYRLGIELFQAASDYGLGRLSREAFVDRVGDLTDGPSYSEVETSCFLSWGQRQIDRAKQNYLRQQEEGLNLRYDESDPPRRTVVD